MRNRLLVAIAVVVLVAPALLAGGLDNKYKNWPSSPQGYFMTNAERAEWKATVKTDADAEAFVKKFLAARAPGFAEDVSKRAEMADKHLTVSGRAGSQTTRGKIIILLGPPSSFATAQREVKGNASGSADMYQNISGGRGGGGMSGEAVGDMAMAAARRNMSGDVLNDYTFTYAADRLPVKQPKDFSIVVEVRAGDGTDRIVDKKAAAQLDEMFEAAAQKSLVANAAPAPAPKP
ncbi:MAG TPA: GWxTD domain-containing protein [Thermoanaerobaculia bacterium]|nr:GWxTD domain-containing protein [Thermoanaerobaculia bacterium]